MEIILTDDGTLTLSEFRQQAGRLARLICHEDLTIVSAYNHAHAPYRARYHADGAEVGVEGGQPYPPPGEDHLLGRDARGRAVYYNDWLAGLAVRYNLAAPATTSTQERCTVFLLAHGIVMPYRDDAVRLFVRLVDAHQRRHGPINNPRPEEATPAGRQQSPRDGEAVPPLGRPIAPGQTPDSMMATLGTLRATGLSVEEVVAALSAEEAVAAVVDRRDPVRADVAWDARTVTSAEDRPQSTLESFQQLRDEVRARYATRRAGPAEDQLRDAVRAGYPTQVLSAEDQLRDALLGSLGVPAEVVAGEQLASTARGEAESPRHDANPAAASPPAFRHPLAAEPEMLDPVNPVELFTLRLAIFEQEAEALADAGDAEQLARRQQLLGFTRTRLNYVADRVRVRRVAGVPPERTLSADALARRLQRALQLHERLEDRGLWHTGRAEVLANLKRVLWPWWPAGTAAGTPPPRRPSDDDAHEVARELDGFDERLVNPDYPWPTVAMRDEAARDRHLYFLRYLGLLCGESSNSDAVDPQAYLLPSSRQPPPDWDMTDLANTGRLLPEMEAAALRERWREVSAYIEEVLGGNARPETILDRLQNYASCLESRAHIAAQRQATYLVLVGQLRTLQECPLGPNGGEIYDIRRQYAQLLNLTDQALLPWPSPEARAGLLCELQLATRGTRYGAHFNITAPGHVDEFAPYRKIQLREEVAVDQAPQ